MKLTNAQEILGLIHLVLGSPQSYRRLIICTPFISESLLTILIGRKWNVNVPLLILTHPNSVKKLPRRFQQRENPITIVAISNLHAKVYLGCGKEERDSVAVLGSFNFTKTALHSNFELGIRFSGKTPQLKHLIVTLERRLMTLANTKHNGE